MTIPQLTCRICKTVGNHQTFIGREMMFGTREQFEYFQCNNCGCLQIAEIPTDPARHYPSNYNPYTITPSCKPLGLWDLLLKQRLRNALFGRGYKLNKLLTPFIRVPEFRIEDVLPVERVLRIAGVKDFSARFLDIGCGSWSVWLETIRSMGFRNLTGIEPYIESSIHRCGIRILKKTVNQVEGQFDLITLHHSLEHIPDQQEVLSAARRLLAPNGVIIVRIPIVSSYAWEKYGVNWVEMDPPRHFFLHSKDSIRMLGEQAGLDLFETLHDSQDFEFYGSEQYLRDIPLTAESSYWKDPSSSIFSTQEIAAFETLAEDVNRKGTSGRAAFFFRARADR